LWEMSRVGGCCLAWFDRGCCPLHQTWRACGSLDLIIVRCGLSGSAPLGLLLVVEMFTCIARTNLLVSIIIRLIISSLSLPKRLFTGWTWNRGTHTPLTWCAWSVREAVHWRSCTSSPLRRDPSRTCSSSPLRCDPCRICSAREERIHLWPVVQMISCSCLRVCLTISWP
jgi:hypothetical protein